MLPPPPRSNLTDTLFPSTPLFRSVVRPVDDLVDRKGGRKAVGIVAVPRRQFLGDAVQPFVEQRLRTSVQGGKAADDARLALRDDQVGTGDDEQRRADDGQARSEEHTSELQSLMRNSYAVFCLTQTLNTDIITKTN